MVPRVTPTDRCCCSSLAGIRASHVGALISEFACPYVWYGSCADFDFSFDLRTMGGDLGPTGMCRCCCGPPISSAARSVVIINLMSSILAAGNNMFSLRQVPSLPPDQRCQSSIATLRTMGEHSGANQNGANQNGHGVLPF